MADSGIEIMDAGLPAGTWGKRLVGAVGLVAGVVLFALVLLVAHSNVERDKAQQRERHSYNILLLVRALDSSISRSEAELGRYVINGERGTGTLYYDAWKQAGRQLNRLAQLTADNPPQAERVKALKDAFDKRGKELAAPATRAFYKQGWAALSLFDKAGHSATIKDMAKIIGLIEDSELQRLDVRADSAAAQTNSSNRLSKLLSGMGLLIGVSALLLGWLAFSALQQRRSARRIATIEAERAMHLERAVAERTSELIAVNARLREEGVTRAAAEARLRQVQKIDAVGQLTGGIAHDFNNMLSVVVGALDLARRRLNRETAEVADQIDKAMEGASRAATLTKQLLSFARHEPLLPEYVHPGRRIAGMSNLLDRTLGERVTLITQGLDGDWLIWVDPSQLENAIVNLAVNARDAMEGDGLLTIAAEQVALEVGSIGSLPAGEYVRISVSDTGCGMDAETRERASEPFFTTKPVGKGTGLGLAQVFGFVRQSGGELVIESEPGKGCEIALYIPRRANEMLTIRDIKPSVRAEVVRETSSLSILVVEDDPRVRAATVAALRELGHTPRACSSGAEALAELERDSDVALVISDVVMPGMSGPQLVEQILQRYPAPAILFVTGYAGEAGSGESFSSREILRKPFTINALANGIAAALDRHAGAGRDVGTVLPVS